MHASCSSEGGTSCVSCVVCGQRGGCGGGVCGGKGGLHGGYQGGIGKGGEGDGVQVHRLKEFCPSRAKRCFSFTLFIWVANSVCIIPAPKRWAKRCCTYTSPVLKLRCPAPYTCPRHSFSRWTCITNSRAQLLVGFVKCVHRPNTAQTPPKHRPNTAQTPPKHRPNTAQIPPKHRPNTTQIPPNTTKHHQTSTSAQAFQLQTLKIWAKAQALEC